jgi:hypothetical protein
MDLKGRVVLGFMLLVSGFAYSAGDHIVIGGRAAALGTTSVTQCDEWSGFNNQAGLGWCTNFCAGIYFENRYLLKDLSLKALAITLPAGRGAFGVSIRHFGFNLYSEMNTGIAYGLRLTKRFSAGVQVDYLRLHVVDGFKDNNVFTCEIGLQFRASEHLWLGLHVANPVPVKISSLTRERLPAIMRFGLSWRIKEGLHSDIEVEKDLIHKPVLKAGIEYRPAKSLFIRMGLLSNPATFTFGFGLEFGNLQFDFASSYHMVLGYSPQASLTYYFGKKKRVIDN